ncbi:general secretion pathway protein J [Bordetella ansorpii]|uniref:General secretion pathway protein J n=1 Tax=Bordetella ansorpii TaxID=288768 RepID=A0A157SRQ8_9BORD|nr:prepilin-type N-terminal cleavage/methylation domain-containing protein [Bordetella ansorpii]SAI72991.1 general secretion pathway protein J [Bordetella ansorpii]
MPDPSRSPAKQQGLTLIEVMVAMLIMSLLSIMAWRAITNAIRVSEHLDHATIQVNTLVQAFDQMERDVGWRSTIEVPAQRATDAIPVTPSVSALAGSSGALRLEIVRAGSRPGTWQRVQWWRAGSRLYRAAGPAAEHYPLPAPAAAMAAVAVEDITNFEVRALMPGRGWVRLPAPGSSETPALGLEVVITQGSASRPLPYRRVFSLRG